LLSLLKLLRSLLLCFLDSIFRNLNTHTVISKSGEEMSIITTATTLSMKDKISIRHTNSGDKTYPDQCATLGAKKLALSSFINAGRAGLAQNFFLGKEMAG
jgi:hypothetical protein